MKIPQLSPSSRPRPSIVEPLECRITPGGVTPHVILIAPTVDHGGGDTVTYTVNFDHDVTGVDKTDFKVSTSGNAKAASEVTVAPGANAASYEVTISGLKGNGDVVLELVDDNSIRSSSNNGLADGNNGSFTGDPFHLIQEHPSVTSIAANGSTTTGASSVSWTVTFSEDVTGVSIADFQLILSGVTTSTPLTITPGANASTYTVTASGLSGTGTVRLDLVDIGSAIKDLSGNPLQTNTVNYSPIFVPTGQPTSGVSSVKAADLNGDGKMDLVVTNYDSDSVTVLLNQGNGSFAPGVSYSTGDRPRDAAVADINGDGKLDIVVSDSSFVSSGSSFTNHSVTVLLGQGDGTFVGSGNYGNYNYDHSAIAVADLNGDGHPDVVQTGNSGIGLVYVMLGSSTGGGTFSSVSSYSVGSGVYSVAIADLNGDGTPDIVSTGYYNSTVSVLIGRGDGTFNSASTFGTGANPVSVAVGDVNGDGRLDIVTANYGGETVSVLLNNGEGFSPKNDYSAGVSSAGAVVLTDVDGDGRLDIVVPSYQSEGGSSSLAVVSAVIEGYPISVLLNDGEGGFNDPLIFNDGILHAVGGAVGDFNGDGRPDVAVADRDDAFVPIMMNNGHHEFAGDTFTLEVPTPDLSVSVSDGTGKTTATPGETLTYTIDYSNLGNISATGVVITIPLPSNTEFNQNENPGWSTNGSTLTKTVGLVSGEGQGSTTLVLHVASVVQQYTSGIYLTATISDDGNNGTDSNTGNNTGYDYDQLTGLTFDPVVKSITDPDLAVPGRTQYFTVTYANLGNVSVDNGVVTVQLPENFTFYSFLSDPRWSYNSGNNTISAYELDLPGGGADQAISFGGSLGLNAANELHLTTEATVSSKFYISDSNTANNSVEEATPIYHGFIVTAPGVAPGNKYAPPVLRVFDKLTGEELYSFSAYESRYRDSIRVAVGDFNQDGIDDIVTTTQHNGGRLRVFDGLTGQLFLGFEEVAVFGKAKSAGGFVAVGDVNNSGGPEIVVGSSLGGGKVKVYSFDVSSEDALPDIAVASRGFGTPTVIKEFTPFGKGFKGGVRVAVGDVDGFGSKEILPEAGDSREGDIIVGQGYYGGTVKAYKGLSDEVIAQVKVGKKGYKGGVSVAVADITGDGRADLIIGRNSGKPSVVEVFDGRTLQQVGVTLNPFDENPGKPKNTFGVRVAASDVNGDGIADIITSVGIKNQSLVKFYDGAALREGRVELINEEEGISTITAYSLYKDVALWIAASNRVTMPV